MMITVQEMMADYDWQEAMSEALGQGTVWGTGSTEKVASLFAPVEAVLFAAGGENNGEDWIALFQCKDGSILYISAGCDYTGWGCQQWGTREVYERLADALGPLGLTKRDRQRFGLPAIPEQQEAE